MVIEEHVGLAAAALVRARSTGELLDQLHETLKPRSTTDAMAIQAAITRALGETVSGWKVYAASGFVGWAALLGSGSHASPARIAPARTAYAVEGEIAFVLREDLPPRGTPYGREDVAALVMPCAAIEVLGSRFRSIANVSALELVADHLANAAFVYGQPAGQWDANRLATAQMRLEIDGVVVAERQGGHPNADPLLPLIALANELRSTRGLLAGEVVTTGSPTGPFPISAGQTASVTVQNVGSVQAFFA